MKRHLQQRIAVGLVAILTLGAFGCDSGDPVSVAGGQGHIQRVFGDISAVALPGGSATVFAPGTGTVRVPDSVRVTLRNLTPLAGGAVYQTWLVRPEVGGKAFPLAGRYVRRVQTTTYDATGPVVGPLTIAESLATPVSSFTGATGTITFTTQSYASTGATVGDTAHTFLVTIENSPGASVPSSRQPLWIRVVRRSTDANNGGGTLGFGTFNFFNGLAAPLSFVPQGRVNGGVIGDSVRVTFDSTFKNAAGQDSITKKRVGFVFVGSEMQFALQGLQRPPLGYRYASYLCSSIDDLCVPTDTSTRFQAAGSLYTADGAGLADADVAPASAWVTATRINEALLTHQAPRTGATLCTFDRIVLALDPKAGITGPPLDIVFSGQMPELIRKARSCS